MTTDNPRELRSAAERLADDCDCRTDGRLVAGYVLATVRDDDGEEQGGVEAFDRTTNVIVTAGDGKTWVYIKQCGTEINLAFKTFTRGQFRALCRGPGITPDVPKADGAV